MGPPNKLLPEEGVGCGEAGVEVVVGGLGEGSTDVLGLVDAAGCDVEEEALV